MTKDENVEFATYAAEIAADAAKYAKTLFDFALYAEKNVAAAEYPAQGAARGSAAYAHVAADSAERAAKFAQYAANWAAQGAAAYGNGAPKITYITRCPACHAKIEWDESGTKVEAQTPADLSAENALCNAAYLAKERNEPSI